LETPTGERVRAVVLDLHRWLIFHRIELSQLTAYRASRFAQRPSRTELTVAEQRRYKEQLKVYLRWLCDQHIIAADPTRRRYTPHPRRPPHPLPELATSFLASLRPTLKPSTCSGYATDLRRLHRWLDETGLDILSLTRHQFAPWLQQLNDLKLAPATRIHILLHVRRYLHWLDERHPLSSRPDDLVRRTDLPRLPVYLPRPLLPEVDRELQRRLAQTEDPYAHGLLLMRHSGLRVGELLRLELQCLRTDGHGHWYLKVPLGKLYTERLVPLDEDTVDLVRSLQDRGPPNRPLLLDAPQASSGSYARCCKVLRAICTDLQDAAPITTHRLRHTYATELLNAGMSLVGVMRLLGHRDYRMTLRYAAISQETVGKEYYQALDRLTEKYRLPLPTAPAAPPDPAAMLEDLARWVRLKAPAGASRHALLNRIARLQQDLDRLHNPSPPSRAE
jgi:site-specific recombinase XerD